MKKITLATSLLLSLTASAANATLYDVEMNASMYFAAANGPINMIGFTGTWDSDTDQGSWTGTTTIPGFDVVMHYTQAFVMHDVAVGSGPNERAGAGILLPLDGHHCTDNDPQPGTACMGLAPALQGIWRNTAVNPSDPNIYKTPVAFTPYDGWTGQWTLSINKILPDGTIAYNPISMNVTLHAVPIPAGAWLFGSGLFALASTAKRRRN